MRRKYDIRNKRTFIIILILSMIIIGIFSLFIYKYKHASKIEYTINTGSIVQDNSKNYLEISEDAILKVRWNGNYYLIYQDKKIGLGKKVIVYDTVSKGIKLYGKFYEITESGKINNYTDETKLNSLDTKFYKLDDREYLLIDKEITSDDKGIDASNYLLVELDRMGNAKLSNYKLNLKTIKPTTLITSRYQFDIANEMLKYNDLEIDLKKIIGTTNEYKEEEKEDKEKDNDGNGNGTNDIANNYQVITNGTNNTGTSVDNTNQNGQYVSIEELKKNVKMTSIISVYQGMNQIDFDYVVYDPFNEYQTVEARIIDDEKMYTVPINKTDTHITFDNLKADTTYSITFYYTTIDSKTNESKEITFGVFDEITTKKPQYNIALTKISRVENRVYYKVYLQEGYSIDEINVTSSIAIDGSDFVNIPSEAPTIIEGSKIAKGSFSIDGYDINENTIIRINVDSVNGQDGLLTINNGITFKPGR